jgi:FtsP/CotA-like multicopper oxidase with cupredoxin domain
MHMTRYTQYAGLLGMYLIRDKEEAALKLPSGRYEIPLVITDRNFAADAGGRPNGQTLHKTVVEGHGEAKVMGNMLAPYTLVNGVIWPYLEVQPRWYRFRLLNATNGRPLRLFLVDEENKPVTGVMKLIGTDQGLLGKPIPLDAELELVSAERADVLVDFGALAGRSLRLVNTVPNVSTGEPAPVNGIPEPDVMQFRVAGKGGGGFALPTLLSPTFKRISQPDVPEEHGARWIFIPPPRVFTDAGQGIEMWEMEVVDAATVEVPAEGIVQLQGSTGRVRTLRRVATQYHETTRFVIPRNSWEVWNFISLARQVHPMHVHATRFQPLGRDIIDRTTWSDDLRGTTAPLKFVRDGAIEPTEEGWKDVIAIRRSEKISVAGPMADVTGRYVYHCHTLEHEAHMMRPFVVLPEEVIHLEHHMHG